jgi:hypothetical protein
VVNDDSIALRKTTASRSGLHNLTARFVTGDDSLITLRALPEVFVVNAANVGTANGGRFDSEQHLPVPNARDCHTTKLHLVVSGQKRGPHTLLMDWHLLKLSEAQKPGTRPFREG